MKFKARTAADQTEQTQIEAEWAALEAATAPETVVATETDGLGEPIYPVETPSATAAVPAVALTPEQFATLLGAIGAQAKTGSGDDVADALSQAIRQARKPIPENEVHSGISVYRPDDGTGKATVAPPFRWPEVWWAAMDEKNDAHPLHPFDWNRCTVAEIQAINSLIPGVRGKIEFADGSRQDVAVIEEQSTGGDLKRLLIGFNFAIWKDRSKYNAIGRIGPLCAQLRELATVAA